MRKASVTLVRPTLRREDVRDGRATVVLCHRPSRGAEVYALDRLRRRKYGSAPDRRQPMDRGLLADCDVDMRAVTAGLASPGGGGRGGPGAGSRALPECWTAATARRPAGSARSP